jgi:hypothetical protein
MIRVPGEFHVGGVNDGYCLKCGGRVPPFALRNIRQHGHSQDWLCHLSDVLFFAEVEDHPGAQAEAAFAVVHTICELRVQIFRLREAHAKSATQFPIDAAAGGEIEVVAGADRSEPRPEGSRVERAAGVAAAD